MAASKKKAKKKVLVAKAKKTIKGKKSPKVKKQAKPKSVKTAKVVTKAKPLAARVARAKSSAPAPKTFSAAELQKILKPLADRLLILVEAAAETTPGGLIIPGLMSQKPNQGKVLAMGSGRRGKKGQVRPLDVQVGDRVMFPEYVGTPVTLNGSELLILREEDVLGIVQ